MAAYLSLVGQNGIILNPDKVEFAEDEVSWAGVRILKEKVAPLEDHVLAIRQFPTPTNITDMRSYFALVNQVSPYYTVQPKILPFRELLKKNARFYWDGVLQKLFEETERLLLTRLSRGSIHLRWAAGLGC